MSKNQVEDITKYFEQKGSNEQNENNFNVRSSQLNDFNYDEVQNNTEIQNSESNIEHDSNTKDEIDVEFNIKDFPVKMVRILKQLCVCHREYGSSMTTEAEGMDKFFKRFKKIRSSGQWATFLYTTANIVL